ncbi:protein of unknown function DUF1778 (plasmid) [Thalassoporum mexicanum PCC 7367]|uniref:hypothetical protein n=1 Tax=Thalassoporum mexicanum TaxID=3457544 RepID=UPI00029FEF9B|nr:hypothetical protein [Pseudanabaena sp. PCC 7367]AFY71998.1 protein of unknown function DUF1778 [Pseudanabaena sp. PCC 7367]
MANSEQEALLQTLRANKAILELSPEDSRLFVQSILQPRPPSEVPKLREAFQRYQSMVQGKSHQTDA